MPNDALDQCMMLAQQLQIILDSLPCSLIVTNPEGRIAYYSRDIGSNLGNNLVGKLFSEAFAHDPHKHTLITLETGREFDGEVYKSTVRGKDRIFRTSTRRIYDARGQYIGVLSFNLDITEQAQMEQKMRVLQQLDLLGQLAASTAHEIRNPVTSIRGFLQLLAQDLSGNPQDLEYIRIMQQELTSIEGTIASFLDLAKPQEPHFAPTDPSLFLAEVHPLLHNLAREHGASLTVSTPSGHVTVKLDRQQIKQVLVNIVLNAVRAVSPAAGQIEVCAFTASEALSAYLRPYAHYAAAQTFAAQPGFVYFTVRDNGTGIPPEQLPKLGTLFYATNTSGTGVGLTVSTKIAAGHGGQLYFLSCPGEGTIVIVKLPLAQNGC